MKAAQGRFHKVLYTSVVLKSHHPTYPAGHPTYPAFSSTWNLWPFGKAKTKVYVGATSEVSWGKQMERTGYMIQVPCGNPLTLKVLSNQT